MKWNQRNEYYWVRECGRYTIERTRSYAEQPEGEWIYLAWLRGSAPDDIAVCISRKRRKSLESARGDCATHLLRSMESKELAAGGAQQCA